MTTVIKRDKRREPFDPSKITKAIERCLHGLNYSSEHVKATADTIAKRVKRILEHKGHTDTCGVEQVQDLVEQQLMAADLFDAAKAYILYREEHRKKRQAINASPEQVKVIAEGLRHFESELQRVQYVDKYARFSQEAGRRETWEEAVDRVMRFFQKHVRGKLSTGEWGELRTAMLTMQVMPSMRVLQMADPALERCNVGAYNCSAAPIDSIQSFAELLYVLMSGVGAGFSVEAEHVDKLPRIKKQRPAAPISHHIADSTEGWCEALRVGLERWFDGGDVTFDFSKIRPQGATLKTKGGQASGPEPLRQLLTFARERVLARQGGRLTTVDAHDIACFCGQIVQVGGVRRAAEISLSDFDDEAMRKAKTGTFWVTNPQRAMANNSAVYVEKPNAVDFMDEWLTLAKSGTGERGIFNRAGLKKQAPKRRKKAEFLVNPCGETVMRPRGLCNLSIAVARHDDTSESLREKVRLATVFGTIQSTLTKFRYLSDKWRENAEEERLLGVDITGQLDCPLLRPSNPNRNMLLEQLRDTAIDANRALAERLGIPASVAVTCVKPSGNSATLLGCSSGLHPRYAAHYIRRIRIGAYTPVAQVLKDSGIPWSPEVGQAADTATVLVFEFPVKSPEGTPTRHDMTAIEQLENALALKLHFCEHNPSCTVYVNDTEWLAAGHWVYEHWDQIGGLSFLPRDNHLYALAPYEEITADEYATRMAALPTIDWSKLLRYEQADMTTAAQELACVAGSCDL